MVTAFSFSRDLEFASEAELAKRMGCPRRLWLRAAVKELIDNALDAAEPARGAQGKALQVLMCLPLGFGLVEAAMTIASRGVVHEIVVR
jgi:hypothetical protein